MEVEDQALFPRFIRRIRQETWNAADRPVTYMAIGDSVTQGWMESGVLDPGQAFPSRFKQLTEQRFPPFKLNLINYGKAGDTAAEALGRSERNLLVVQPDFVTIGFGLNDALQGKDGLNRFKDALHEWIRIVRENSEAELLLLTPNGMMSRNNSRIHENDRKHVDTFLALARTDTLERYRQTALNVAESSGTACLDVYHLWMELGQDGTDLHTHLANGINHPNRDFHKRIASAMEKLVFHGAEGI